MHSASQVCFENITCCQSQRHKLQVKFAISPRNSILIPGQPVPTMTKYRQVTGRAGTWAPMSITGTTRPGKVGFVCLLVGCLTSQQHPSLSQGRICSDNFTCCHTETEVADQTFYLTQSQNTDTRPTSTSADPIMPGAWQGSHWSANL